MTPSTDDLSEMYRRMYRIRVFEQQAAELYRATEVPGFLHLSIGQEACAVGACWSLREDDVIVSNHRGHGHCIAKGLDPESMLAELMGARAALAMDAVAPCTSRILRSASSVRTR